MDDVSSLRAMLDVVLGSELADQIQQLAEMRAQVLADVVVAWCKGDMQLARGLVLETYNSSAPIPRLCIRVVAGPYWEEWAAGAGPVLVELPAFTIDDRGGLLEVTPELEALSCVVEGLLL